MRTVIFISLLSVSATTNAEVAPVRGAATIKITRASWCGADVNATDKSSRPDALERKFQRLQKRAKLSVQAAIFESISGAGRAVCGAPQDPDRLRLATSLGQVLANEHGFTQQEVVLAFNVLSKLSAFKLRDYGNKPPQDCEKFETPRHAGPLQRSESLVTRIGLNCADPTSAEWMLWNLDRGATLPNQVARLGWLYASYGYTANTAPFARGLAASIDLSEFDERKYAAELDALGISDEIKLRALLRMKITLKKAAGWRAYYVKEFGKRDFNNLLATYKKAYAQWQQEYVDNKTAVDFAWRMEALADRGDKRKFTGCRMKATKYATDFIMARRPKTIEDIEAAASKPIGVLIMNAALACENALGNKLSGQAYAAFIKNAPITRGPRFAAKLAVAQQVATIRKSVSRFPLRPESFKPHLPRTATWGGRAGSFAQAFGVIKSVEKRGDSITLSFKRASYRVPIHNCRETNRIDRITADGQVKYRRKCKVTGYQTMTHQEKPVTIAASAAAKLKRGKFLTFARDRRNPTQGFPKILYRSKKRNKVLAYYGLPLN